MKWRIIAGKQPETYDIVHLVHQAWKPIEVGFKSLEAARQRVLEMIHRAQSEKLWFPGTTVEEFDDEV